jgi:hypothetical protein
MAGDAARPLSPAEATLWRLDRASPVGFTTIARVTGRLDEAALRAGLAAAQARHPLLRVRIEAVGIGGARFVPGAGEIPLRCEDGPADGWAAVAEREVNTSVPWARAPLARAVWLRHGPEDGTLLVTLHHSVGDGKSGVFVVRDVLAGAVGLPLGEARPFHGPVEARIALRGARLWWVAARTLGRELWRMARHGRPRPLVLDTPGPPSGRRYRVRGLGLDPDATARLTERARAEGTTVHGALSAALLQAVATVQGGPATMGCGSAVDIRRHVVPPLADEVLFAVSAANVTVRVSPDGDLWALARAIRADLLADVERGGPLALHHAIHVVLRLADRGRLDPDRFAALAHRANISTTGVTNLGRLDVPERYGPLTARTMHFVVGPSALADLVTTSTSFAGRLAWNFVAATPQIADARLDRIVAEATRRLDQASSRSVSS